MPEQSNNTSSVKIQSDQLHRYIFDELNCRGELVKLNQSLNQIFANHQYPQPVKELLAEMMAVTALLTATLKFKGDIAVQIQGNGPVSYAVINGNDQLQMRGMARVQGEIGHSNLSNLVGKAHLVITINPEQGERYQGIVLVEGETVAECIENYFQQSEQLRTKIWTATSIKAEDNHAAALFLQIMPLNDTASNEDFDHLAALSQTVKTQELLQLDAIDLLTRLYHQDNPRVFDPQNIEFKCSCSREKTATALQNMEYESLIEQVEEQGPIQVDCQFCLKRYSFDKTDIMNIHKSQ